MSVVESDIFAAESAFTGLTVSDGIVKDPAKTSAKKSMIITVVKKHLETHEWKYETHVEEERTIINTRARGKNGDYGVVMDIKEQRHILFIYICPQVNFPEKNRRDLAVYIARANYGLTIGNFELDMNDGEIRFKCTAAVEDGVLTDGMFSVMLRNALISMDIYFEDMVKVGYGVMSPKEAIQEVEGDKENAVRPKQ